MIKKLVSTILAFTVAAGLITGCGSKNTNAGEAKAKDSDEVNLVMYLYGTEGWQIKMYCPH